jgi:hypothetical protein
MRAATVAGAALSCGLVPVSRVWGRSGAPVHQFWGLTALCYDLNCPDAICKACLQALPAREATRESLGPIIIAELSSAGRDSSSSVALRNSIRDRSRSDFTDGRIATIDGWMLSRTEMRIYAFCGLLTNGGES